MSTADSIRNQQKEWARQHGIACDSRGYVVSLEHNFLSFPLMDETRLAFEGARTRELRTTAGQGRMRALDSSAALMVNFFEYWLRHGVEDVAGACGASLPMSAMRFQPAYLSPLGEQKPHMHVDIEFTGMGAPILVLAKFTETYRRSRGRRLGRAYLHDPALWQLLPGCKMLASQLDAEPGTHDGFLYLDVPNLLVHILGLSSRCGVNGFQLVYLWYDTPSREALRHREELDEFAGAVGNEVIFRHLTYQELFQKLLTLPGVGQDYLTYLNQRYFGQAARYSAST
jgi:hypothetical protein